MVCTSSVSSAGSVSSVMAMVMPDWSGSGAFASTGAIGATDSFSPSPPAITHHQAFNSRITQISTDIIEQHMTPIREYLMINLEINT